MNEIQNSIENFMKIIGDAEERFKFLCDEIQEADNKQLDLLHEIESGKYNVCQGYKKLAELQQLRKYRRQLKEERYLLEPVFNYVKDHKNISIDLFKMKRPVDKVSTGQEEKVYRYRAKDKRGTIMQIKEV
jgi:hypothetical protein